MQRFKILALMSILTTGLSAQIINTGATIVIQSGATLKVETDIINTSGTITNNGIIEVSGHFTNDATNGILTPNVGLIRFIGTGDTNLDTGGDALNNVEMAKTADGTVALTAPAQINGDLAFTGTGSKIVLGTNDLTLAATSAVNTPGANGYVVTTGTGRMIKGVAGAGPKTLEIGDASNYSPITNTISGTFNNATIAGRVVNTVHPSKPASAESFLKRHWKLNATGITNFQNTMTGTYVSGDTEGTPALIKGASYDGADWYYADAATNGSSTVTGTTKVGDVNTDFTGTNFFGKANLRVLLAGPYMGEGMMSTSLNSILPASSPYSVAPFNAPNESYSVKPVNATDWILVELRDPVTPSTVLSQKSAWLLNNGDVVGLDGNALTIKDGNPNSIVSIRHRNHLGIRTSDSKDLVNPTLHNYTSGLAFGTHPQRISGGVHLMWPGNTLVDGFVKFSGSDNDSDALKNNILAHPSNPFGSLTFSYLGYNSFDVNMDGTIRFSGTNNDRDNIKNIILAHPSNPFGSLTYTINQQL